MVRKANEQIRQGLYNRLKQLSQTAHQKQLNWLLRSYFLLARSSAAGNGGFVLPVAAVVLLVVSLTVGAFLFRLSNRGEQVVLQREEFFLDNAARPGIDRAKAKLAYLFQEDALPSLPTDSDFEAAFDGTNKPVELAQIYTLEDETQLDITGDGVPDPTTWSFEQDSDNDGEPDAIIVYSIVFKNQSQDLSGNTIDFESPDEEKAANEVVRNGPLNLTGQGGTSSCDNVTLAPEEGWEPVTGGLLRKAFQVNAVAIKPNRGQVISTLEYQQDREAALGNKWGAWFKYDLEIHNGPPFRWNGAMYTDGNLILRVGINGNNNNQNNGPAELHMVSSESSCIFSDGASEIVLNQATDNDGDGEPDFQGQVIYGQVSEDNTTINANGPTNIVYRRPGESITYQPDSPSSAGNQASGTFLELVSAASGSNQIEDSFQDSKVPSDAIINPILQFTTGQTVTRTGQSASNLRDPDWDTDAGVLRATKRIVNRREVQVLIDDTYRADNRWGPKPTYDANNPDLTLNCAENRCSGQPIVGEEDLTRNEPLNPEDEDDFGLDGYWERRGRAQGLRVIVGQRLELGNPLGWLQDGPDRNGVLADESNEEEYFPDPLYHPAPRPLQGLTGIPNGYLSLFVDPPNAVDFTTFEPSSTSIPQTPTEDGINSGRTHEMMQGRTLRDNLAAVQSTAVYHYLNEGGNFPLACMATVSHPGTPTTIRRSTDFSQRLDGNVVTDFLYGQGTNGWEFAPPGNTASEAQFAGQLVAGANLRLALDNLANFAGDPFGAFPVRQDGVTGSAVAGFDVTHPYPFLTMWGNFSNLRGVLNSLGTTGYDDLSIADKSTLHTASCTLGILAYHLNVLQNYVAYQSPAGSDELTRLNRLDDALTTVFGTVGATPGDLDRFPDDPANDLLPGQTPTPDDYIESLREAFIEDRVFIVDDAGNPIPGTAIPNDPSGVNPDANLTQEEKDVLDTARLLHEKVQVQRDRQFGFRSSPVTYNTVNDLSATFFWDLDSNGSVGLTETLTAGAALPFALGCDITAGPNGNGYFGLAVDPATPPTPAEEATALRLALTLCSTTPKFPSLFYLFPFLVDNNHLGTLDGDPTNDQNGALGAAGINLNVEPYVADQYIQSAAVNGAVTYRNLDPATIALTPGGQNPTGWITPAEVFTGGSPNGIRISPTAAGNDFNIAFQDKAFFNGRELMVVRALDIDLDLLRRSAFGTDFWLPLPPTLTRTGAMVYAFREDAIREDDILRPARAAWNDGTWNTYVGTSGGPASVPNYVMNALPGRLGELRDPPLNPATGISPKPVDFYPDPERRPHGFRLRRGDNLTRDVNDLRGMTFVSHNPVYIMGDFNRHVDLSGTNPIEEFTDLLQQPDPANALQAWSNFYQRTSLNTDFATTNDRWRSTEVLGDAVYFLSDQFREGSIIEGIIGLIDPAGGTTQISANHSFASMSHPQDAAGTDAGGARWLLENGSILTADPTPGSVDQPLSQQLLNNAQWPVAISRNGYPLTCNLTVPGLPSVQESWCPYTNAGNNTRVSYFNFGSPQGSPFLRFERLISGIRNRDLSLPSVADPTTINTLFAGGLVPSRRRQNYGGLHNFPRMLENWAYVGQPVGTDAALELSGSMLQLDFSVYSTGPFLQRAWEPGEDPGSTIYNSGEGGGQPFFGHYSPPSREWGYDPALQYVPPSPAARRLVSFSDRRSDYFREPAVDDPYVERLLCALDASDSGVVSEDLRPACR